MSRPALVVVAAGAGERLGLAVPKAFAPYRGSSVLGVAVRNLAAVSRPIHIVVVAPSGHVDEAGRVVAENLAGSAHTVSVVTGGATRQESVRRGLAAVPDTASIILVHDAARAGTPAELVESIIAHVEQTGRGAIPGLPVTDTVKRVAQGSRITPVEREGLYAVQTPQGFPAHILRKAYELAEGEFTDDAGLVSAAGGDVDVIPGSVAAAKITYAEDLADRTPVTGIGTDIHRFGNAADGALRLGGLDWPGEPPLVGHSDGDVVLHAICDALLSAARLGDLGTHFGSARPEFAGANSAVFVHETLRLVAAAGFEPVFVAVQLVGEHPRVAGRRIEIESSLTALLGVPVSFAATTTDKLGFLGVSDGLAAVATATVHMTIGAAVSAARDSRL